MATKKLYSNASSTYYYLLESLFTEDSTSTANNTSTLTLTANISNHDIRYTSNVNSTLKIYWYDNNLNANGTLVASLNVKSIYPSSASTVMTKTATGTVTVTHKDDGTLSGYAKAVWTKASGASNYCPNSGDVSTATTALTNIPRYAKITSFSVSKRDETSVTFNYATDVACDLIEYSKNNGSSWFTLPSNKIVTGLSANTSYNFKLRVRRTDSQLKTTSDTVAQTTYAYPYLTSTPNFVIGNALTVSFYNPLNRTVTLQITANGVTDTGSYASTGTSYTGYNAFNNQQFLYSSLGTSGKTATYSMTLTCLQQTSTKTGTYSIDETACKPVINANSSIVRDVNTNITTLTLDASKIVKNFSTARLHVVANKISNVYDTTATISYYKYVGDGSTWTSGDKDISNATAGSYQVQIVNSRGIASDIVTLSATLHPYFNQTVANFRVVRPTQVGNEMKLSANGALFHQYFDSGNQNYNTTTIKWYVRTSPSDSWTLGGNITNDSSMSYTTTSWNFAQKLISNPLNANDHTWDYMTQYYFKIEIIDRLQTVNSTTYVSIGQAYYEWWRDNDKNYFKVNGDARINNDLNVSGYVNLLRRDSGGSWIKARENAVVNQTRLTTSSGSSWNPVASVKTTAGNWSIGNVGGENLIFAYDRDTNYNNNLNRTATWTLQPPTTSDNGGVGYQLGLVAYPVGSIYMSVSATSPQTLFGGTWEQLKNHFLFATNATSGDKGGSGNGTGTSTGQATGNTGSTTLTSAQSGVPAHAHTITGTTHKIQARCTGSAGTAQTVSSYSNTTLTQNSGDTWSNTLGTLSKSHKTDVISWTDGGTINNNTAKDATSGHTHTLNSHTHTIPYIEVYVWKRTA